jgi:uncharacterized protein (DUF362 family)
MADCLAELIAAAHPDGGWGYVPEQPPQLEPTCLGILAASLDPAKNADVLAKARRFLASCRQPDGSYPLAHGRKDALWSSALVLFVEATLHGDPKQLANTARLLVNYRGKVPAGPKHDEIRALDPNHDIDVRLIGWPWAINNFSWVEPTSWACLALRRIGQVKHPRVQEGLALLVDRAMDTGGINYGNRRILDKILEPIPGPTALMLLAVQGRKHPRIDAAVQYLLREINTHDVEHLAWTKIAIDLYRDHPGVPEALTALDAKILAALEERKSVPWVQPANIRLALAAIALGTSTANPFRLPDAIPEIAVPTGGSPAGQKTLGEKVNSWFRGMALKGVSNLRDLPTVSGVHIARAADYDGDLVSVLKKQYESFRSVVSLKDKRVVLKPNLVEYHRDKVINTNPKFIGAVIELCKAEGAREVIVAEGPGHWRNVEFLVAESGLGEVLARHGVRFVDLNHDEPVKMPNLGQLTGLEAIYLAKTIAKADVVISLPKLKTHHWAGATLSMKNLFGTVPGICYGWPKNELHWRGIDNSIVDIALTRTPELAIVDGIIGMEGDGPLKGDAKPFGAIIMGHDLVAVDATCCRLMMLDPSKIGYLMLGHMKKLGRFDPAEIPQLGETISALAQPFAQVPHFAGLCVKPA